MMPQEDKYLKSLGYVCLPTLLALFFYWESLEAYFTGIDLEEIRFTLYEYYGSNFFPGGGRSVTHCFTLYTRASAWTPCLIVYYF